MYQMEKENCSNRVIYGHGLAWRMPYSTILYVLYSSNSRAQRDAAIIQIPGSHVTAQSSIIYCIHLFFSRSLSSLLILIACSVFSRNWKSNTSYSVVSSATKHFAAVRGSGNVICITRRTSGAPKIYVLGIYWGRWKSSQRSRRHHIHTT